MNDVKDLCDRILDKPAPPLRDSTQVLAIARHAARRRAQLTAAAGGLACAVVAAVAVTVAMPVAPADAPPAQQPSTTELPSPAAAPMPDADAAQAHGGRVAQLLAEAVPTGYTSRPDGATSTWRLAADTATKPRFVSQTRIVVSDGSGEGGLSAALVGDGLAAPSGELCAPTVTARLGAYTGNGTGPGTCAVASVNGVPVRTDISADQTVTATRFLNGGYLTIRWSSSRWQSPLPTTDAGHPWVNHGGSGRPPLEATAFTPTALAELTANPRLLP